MIDTKLQILRRLEFAETALRGNLQRDLDETARSHIQRAISHLHEACVAINDGGRARSIDQLQDDLKRADEIINRTKALSGHEHKYGDVRCAQFGLWRGARRENIPKRIFD